MEIVGIGMGISIAVFFLILVEVGSLAGTVVLFVTLSKKLISLPQTKTKHHTASMTISGIVLGISIAAFFCLLIEVGSLAVIVVLFATL